MRFVETTFMAVQGSRWDALDGTIGGTMEAPLPDDDKLSELLQRLRARLTAMETGRITPGDGDRFSRRDLVELESQVAALSTQLADEQSRLSLAAAQLESVTANYERLKSRRLVRVGLSIARWLAKARRFGFSGALRTMGQRSCLLSGCPSDEASPDIPIRCRERFHEQRLDCDPDQERCRHARPPVRRPGQDLI